MARLGALFVATCILLIAASTGAVGYLSVGLTGAEAAILALATMTALGLLNLVSARLRDRSDVGAQIADLARGSTDLARQVAELGRRMASVEGKLETLNRPRGMADPLAAEIGELGTLVKQLAETVAAHDAALAAGADRTALPPRPKDKRLGEEAPATEAASRPQARAAARDDAAMQALVAAALSEGRIDLYLQPIVTLPQRKVRYYEALSRLRREDGEVLSAGDFLAAAEAGGLMPQIDALALFRSVQVVRRLLMKNREIGVFCNLSAATLSDAAAFRELSDFVEANRALATSLVFEFSQAAVHGLGPIEQEGLAALAERGFRFSMDRVSDLRLNPRELSERGFRFVKVAAALLLDKRQASEADIHPADLSDLLARHGIELIADRIEAEASVVDLLDYEVRYGQGLLFSPPRPVRQDALRGIPEHGEGLARERGPGEERAPARAAAPAGQRPGSLGQLARGVLDPA